jgi:hypothetical protein
VRRFDDLGHDHQRPVADSDRLAEGHVDRECGILEREFGEVDDPVSERASIQAAERLSMPRCEIRPISVAAGGNRAYPHWCISFE